MLRATTACTCSTSGRHLDVQKWSKHVVLLTFLLPNLLHATTGCTFSTSQRPKVVQDRRVLTLFTSKCASHHNGAHFFNISTSKSRPNVTVFDTFASKRASHHNGVHFFDISTSKSGLNPMCFTTFHFQMCFAPQRRALFQHLNFQKWSEHEVF